MSDNRTVKKEERSSRIKKSVVLSGLVGTGGLFVAKLLGLVYSIPLSSILASDAYMGYYGNAYRIYNYILNNDSSSIVNGDQDGDGSITAGDVTFVYNILLGSK